MQPGVLEQAPKTFIGTIDQLSEDEKNLIQDLLVQKFPTISILDVERTGKKILQVITQDDLGPQSHGYPFDSGGIDYSPYDFR